MPTRLPFLDRDEEIRRLTRLLEGREGGFGVLHGRRRCGKSRLLYEVLPAERTVYYVGDDREAALQRASLATEVARLLPGFDRVSYPGWDALLARWWSEAPPGAALALDELPALVATSPELPSVLQKRLDRAGRDVHLLVAGSSQRMMQGLVLDRTAPLFGRATEILKVGPLAAGWIRECLPHRDAAGAVEAYSVWGGTPRYWELAADHPDLATAVRDLVLSPLGVLYEEPSRLLLDDLRDTTQSASILSLVGQGCHRPAEIAGRIGRPSTSLGRPLQRLVELDLVRRETPFGVPPRGTKRALYRISDPFLRYWFRFVDPARSRLEARQVAAVERGIAAELPHHVGEVWEELARASVPRLELFGRRWGPAARWWGPDRDHRPMEIDLVAESEDGDALLVGEVEWRVAGADAARDLAELERKAARLPLAAGRPVMAVLWRKTAPRGVASARVVDAARVLDVLR